MKQFLALALIALSLGGTVAMGLAIGLSTPAEAGGRGGRGGDGGYANARGGDANGGRGVRGGDGEAARGETPA